MRPPDSDPADEADSPIDEAASLWVVRHDRGLTAAEEAEFRRWLAADSRHATAMSRLGAAWAVLMMTPTAEASGSNASMTRETRPAPAWRWAAWSGLAAAAAMAVAVIPRSGPPAAMDRGEAGAPLVATTTTGSTLRTLSFSDGTIVRLNAGSELVEQFTAAERRVRLVRGEAYFDVAKNPARPFVVVAQGAAVQAVGTAFNVHVQPQAVDVIVTEGEVLVAPPQVSVSTATNATPSAAGPRVLAGHRAVVPRAAPASGPRVLVTPTNAGEVQRALAWRESLLRLDGTTLAELVQGFEQRTGRRIVLRGESLPQLRVGGRLPADDVEGFVRVLEANYDVSVQREADGTIILGSKP